MEIEHTFGPDNTCTECGMEKHVHTLTAWEPSGGTDHCTHRSGCGREIYESHEYDENSHCEICDYTCSHNNWQKYVPVDDGLHHKYVCGDCNKEFYTEEHDGYFVDLGEEGHSCYCTSCYTETTSAHTYDDGDVCTKCGHPKSQNDIG